MENANTGWGKIFLGLGILAVISGIYFILQKDYVEGILGISVGLLLVFQNRKKNKDKNSE